MNWTMHTASSARPGVAPRAGDGGIRVVTEEGMSCPIEFATLCLNRARYT